MPDILDPSLHPEKDERRRCAFCAYEGPLGTREHIWPERLWPLLPQRLMHHESGDTSDMGSRRIWPAKPFTTKRRIDCDECNHVRLERIEARAAPCIALLARDNFEGRISLDCQLRIAAFAFRMLAVGQYTNQVLRPVPRNHREYLAEHATPPPRVYGSQDEATEAAHRGLIFLAP